MISVPFKICVKLIGYPVFEQKINFVIKQLILSQFLTFVNHYRYWLLKHVTMKWKISHKVGPISHLNFDIMGITEVVILPLYQKYVFYFCEKYKNLWCRLEEICLKHLNCFHKLSENPDLKPSWNGLDFFFLLLCDRINTQMPRELSKYSKLLMTKLVMRYDTPTVLNFSMWDCVLYKCHVQTVWSLLLITNYVNTLHSNGIEYIVFTY